MYMKFAYFTSPGRMKGSTFSEINDSVLFKLGLYSVCEILIPVM